LKQELEIRGAQVERMLDYSEFKKDSGQIAENELINFENRLLN